MLEKPWITRSILLLIVLGTVYINQAYFYNSNVFGLYFLSFIFVGLAFWQNWFLSFLSASALFLIRYYFNSSEIPTTTDGQFHFGLIALQFAVNLFPVYAVSLLIKQLLIQQKQSTETIFALVKALDSSDPYTATHSENVAKYALLIAKKLKLSDAECSSIHTGGQLHDIGKIGIPGTILNKNGRLTDEEFSLIKEHPVIGYNTLKHMVKFKAIGVLDMILYHHERYDGKGYPEGLKENEIPLYARIICVADSFDAMTSKRRYRDQLDFDMAFQELRNNKGTQFDPELVDVFIEGLATQITLDKGREYPKLESFLHGQINK